MKREVLGVKIDDLSEREILETVENWLDNPAAGGTAPRLVFTPGPEFLLTAQKDQDFKKILNNADLCFNESFGLKLYCGFRNRVAGVDMMLEICKLAEKHGWSVGLFGGAKKGIALETSKILKEKFPGLRISFTIDSQEADKLMMDMDRHSYTKLPYDMVDIIFVNLGHPKQEKFLWKLKSENLKSGGFKVGMGVGGSFDLISGSLPRAPGFLQSLGLEWLWRGLTKPGHFSRAVRASIVFPIKYFISKI